MTVWMIDATPVEGTTPQYQQRRTFSTEDPERAAAWLRSVMAAPLAAHPDVLVEPDGQIAWEELVDDAA